LFGGDDLQPAAFVMGSIWSLQLTFLLGPTAGGFFQYILYDLSNDGACPFSNLFALLLASTAFGIATTT
jgi:hypothetical protein